MPRKDTLHDNVVNALIKDGWTITDDPLYVKVGRKELYIDLGAERLLAAERNNERIAVEVKSFTHISFITAFYEALGKFILYEEALEKDNNNRLLFLAVPLEIYVDEMEDELLIKSIIRNRKINLLVFDSEKQIVEKWIK